MKTLIPLALLASTSLASAVVVGVEDFSYADGPVDTLAGGTGFNYDNFDGAVTTTASDWDNEGGVPTVSGGTLQTDGTSASREYNGNIEGAGGPANDGQDDHERSGAARGAGQVFYRFDITRSSAAVWSGASTYDFGAERVFFGVPGSGAGTDTIGIGESGVGDTLGTISLADNVTYTLVAVVDFDNSSLGLFVDPVFGTDFWDPSTGANNADVTRAYGATNWSTAVRFGSGGQTNWDNLTVALDDPNNVGLSVPEPSVGMLSALLGLVLLRRRR